MKSLQHYPIVMLVTGFVLGAAVMVMQPQQPLKAAAAGGNDKFSMATVPITNVGDGEAVFVLDHLTGILRGGVVSNQTGGFAFTYARNVAAYFQVNPATP